MTKLTVPALLLASLISAPAFAHGASTGLLSVGATVLSPRSVATVTANVANTVKANVNVGGAAPSNNHASSGPALADVKANVADVAKANVDVASHGQLLGISLDLGGNTEGGVGGHSR